MLDSTDLRMARVALNYYVRAHALCKRPIPPAALVLADHLEQAVSAIGPQCVRPQEQLITTREAARITGYSQRHIRRLAPHIGHRIGRAWLIRADALPAQETDDNT